MKTRVLYFAVFVYFSLVGGRFTSTFLEHELRFTENWMISCAMATQLLSSGLCSSWLGGIADSWEASKGGGNRGRLAVISIGLLLSTVATLLHTLGDYGFEGGRRDAGGVDDLNTSGTESDNPGSGITLPLLVYHLLLRALFAVGTSACVPVLDGLTLAQLELEGRDRQEYGKERVWGAISWGIAHTFFGPAIDRLGFRVLYATTVLAFIGCMVTFLAYAKCNSTSDYTKISSSIDGNGRDSNMSRDTATEWQKIDDCSHYENDTAIDFQNGNILKRLTFTHMVKMILKEAPILRASFVFSFFALYIGMSVVEQLIFLYFEFLGGSNTMCGITVSVTVLFELPLFQFAPNVLKSLVYPMRLLQLASFAYVVRVIGYSLVPNAHPYWVLLFEPLHGVTIAFATTSSVAVADEWMPKGYESSGQCFMSTIKNLGQFVGLCIAGTLEGRALYRVLAAIVAIGSLTLAAGSYSASGPRIAVADDISHGAPALREVLPGGGTMGTPAKGYQATCQPHDRN